MTPTHESRPPRWWSNHNIQTDIVWHWLGFCCLISWWNSRHHSNTDMRLVFISAMSTSSNRFETDSNIDNMSNHLTCFHRDQSNFFPLTKQEQESPSDCSSSLAVSRISRLQGQPCTMLTELQWQECPMKFIYTDCLQIAECTITGKCLNGCNA